MSAISATTTSMVDVALAYAEMGWKVLRIGPGDKNPNLGKRWRKKATTDLDQIDRWWSGSHANDGIGILTGPESGIWVLDVDVVDKKGAHKKGPETLRALQAEHGEWPATVAAVTGSGGAHFFFKWDPSRPITGGMAHHLEGLDARGEGNQVIVSPSVHETGNRYRWKEGRSPWNMEPAGAPEWLYDLLLDPEPVTEAPGGPESNGAGIDVTTIASTNDDDSPANWVRANHTWDQLLSRDGWTFHHRDGGDVFWTRPGKDKRLGHSAVDHGDGPLVIFSTDNSLRDLWNIGTPTDDGSGVSVTRFDYIAATQYGGDEKAAASAIRKHEMPATTSTTSNVETTEEETEETDPAEIFMSGIVSGEAALNLPGPEPMVGTWLDRGMVAQLVGPYGSGKTFVALELALSVASGRDWLGQPIHHEGQVLYVAAEGGYTMPDRLRAWTEESGRRLPGNFLLYPHRFDITDNGMVTGGLWTPLRAALDQQRLTPALVILDTRSRLTTGDENASESSARLLQACDTIRDLAPNVTILVIHHPGHNATRRGRGHSSFEDNLDVVWSLEGRLKDAPVKLVDEKQKARAQNDQPIWLDLTSTEGGLPRLTTTTEPVDDEEDGRVIRAKILAIVEAHPGRCTVSNLHTDKDSVFYVGTRRRVQEIVKSLVSEGELVVREHKHPDTDRKAERLFLPSLISNGEGGGK